MNICGIDPGLQGALAYISHNGKATVMDMPLMPGMHNSKIIDHTAITDILVNMWYFPNLTIIIERPTWRPRNGARQTMTTWFNYGRLTAACEDWGEVQPAVWKKQMGLSQDKADSLEMARDLFPNLGSMLQYKKNHGRAEALLIAEWFRRSLRD